MSGLEWALIIWVFVLGLCIGSFLNVVALRALSSESIVFPSSKCPICQNPLKWWHNIPVLSYICLRGKCAFCGTKISIQYPIVELLTAILFLIIYLKFGIAINTLFIWIIISILMVIAITDIKEQCAFDIHSYILAGVGLLYNFFNFGNLYSGKIWIFNQSFVASILGILLALILITTYSFIGYLISKKQVIGWGDFYIAAALGAVFGWKYLLMVLLISFITQAILILPMFLWNLYKKQDYVTFYSFLGFIALSVAVYILNTFTMCYLGMLFVIFLGVYLVRRILKNLKNAQECFTAPFGPAMLIATVLVFVLII